MSTATNIQAAKHTAFVSVDLIDDDNNDMRRVTTKGSDQLMITSLRRHGMLQPIALRRSPDNPERYQIVFGRRRLHCAPRAGLTDVPATIRDWTNDQIRAAQATENMQRVPPHPIDVWLTVKDLTDQGMAIADAAEELGLDEQTTRRMERLGRVHPDVLKLIEIVMPNDAQLRVIANATEKAQRAAVKGIKPGEGFSWYSIAAQCQVARIGRGLAIFDPDSHPALWDEDLFAPADDEARFTTRDLQRFLKLQRNALVERVEAQRKERRRVEIADLADGKLKLPKGFRALQTLWGGNSPKPRKIECIFTGVLPDGRIVEILAEDLAAKRAAEKKVAERAKAKTAEAMDTDATAAGPETGGDDAPDAGDAVEEVAVKPTMTKVGAAMVAAAKEAAFHKRLSESDFDLTRTTALLILALAGDNVRIWGEGFEDLAAKLLAPGGALLGDTTADDIAAIAREAIGRMVRFGQASIARYNDGRSTGTVSGDAGEWIGAAIGAGDALDRFDSAEFLATLSVAELRRAAEGAGLLSTGSGINLRERLTDRAERYRPERAVFGAAAPREGA